MSKKLVIDLITRDPKSGEYALYLVEDGPWPTEEDHDAWDQALRRIQDRIYDLVESALDGRVAQLYPQTQSQRLGIQVDSPHGCPDGLGQLVRRMDEHTRESPEFASDVGEGKPVAALRIVTGHEIGRWGAS